MTIPHGRIPTAAFGSGSLALIMLNYQYLEMYIYIYDQYWNILDNIDDQWVSILNIYQWDARFLDQNISGSQLDERDPKRNMIGTPKWMLSFLNKNDVNPCVKHYLIIILYHLVSYLHIFASMPTYVHVSHLNIALLAFIIPFPIVMPAPSWNRGLAVFISVQLDWWKVVLLLQ